MYSKLEKDLKIPYASHFICLLSYYMYPTRKKKKKMHACKTAAGGEPRYIPLLSVMTLHYDRLYQISSLAVNLSLEDLK